LARLEIDEIRGVDSWSTLKVLLGRSLVRILGKREEVGRPTLYGTTKEFLDFFSLGDLRELPTLREYSELTAESRKVMSDRLGIDPDGPDGSDASDATNGRHGTNGAPGPNRGNSRAGGGDDAGAKAHAMADAAAASSDDDGMAASASARDLAEAVAVFLSSDDGEESAHDGEEAGEPASNTLGSPGSLGTLGTLGAFDERG